MLVLGIESTCDETACAIVRSGTEVLSNVVSSQTDLHNALEESFLSLPVGVTSMLLSPSLKPPSQKQGSPLQKSP